jgi:hypothetical protein
VNRCRFKNPPKSPFSKGGLVIIFPFAKVGLVIILTFAKVGLVIILTFAKVELVISLTFAKVELVISLTFAKVELVISLTFAKVELVISLTFAKVELVISLTFAKVELVISLTFAKVELVRRCFVEIKYEDSSVALDLESVPEILSFGLFVPLRTAQALPLNGKRFATSIILKKTLKPLRPDSDAVNSLKAVIK